MASTCNSQGPRSKFSSGGLKKSAWRKFFLLNCFLFNLFLFLQISGGGLSPPSLSLCAVPDYWDTCGSPVIKCLCFFVVFFFSSATKWKNCAIVPIGHWALNAMKTNCDPMRCSHAYHACYLDDWRCRAWTGPGHMTNHELLIRLFCQSVCISACLDYDHL